MYMYMYIVNDMKQNAVQLYNHQMTCIMHMCIKSHVKYMYMYTWLSLSHDPSHDYHTDLVIEAATHRIG